MTDRMLVAPSILAADLLQLGQEVQRMEKADADWIHVDIMDAHFVPNLSFGPAVVQQLKKATALPLDVHLMMDNPDKYIDVFAKAGAADIAIHAEADGDMAAMLQKIRSLGVKSGLSLKPGTPVTAVQSLLPLCDMVLVMTVEPGFGGQKLLPEVTAKIRELREIGYQGLIEADGGLNDDIAAELRFMGLDIAVMGTSLFRAQDPVGIIKKCHSFR